MPATTGNIPAARFYHTLTSAAGKLYMFGGYNGQSKFSGIVNEFDCSDSECQRFGYN